VSRGKFQKPFLWLFSSLPALCLAGCDGGATGSASGAGIVAVEAPAPAPTPAPAYSIATVDAVRLAKQASFGPTPELVDHIARMGAAAWIDEQFVATGSTYSDIAAAEVPSNFCKLSDGPCLMEHHSRRAVATRFYADAVNAGDQLRQRVAFALSQRMIATAHVANSAAGLAAYNQIFLDNAFGNYRDILQQVTMSSFMGRNLDLSGSSAAAPSENYARELLQLFTMGPDALAPDGTVMLDASGAPIPNYTTDDIRNIARALTGWTLARLNGAPITASSMRDYTRPMIAVPSRYDAGEKRFLGVVIGSGTGQAEGVQKVVDAAFNHSSTAPHVARFLIQQLVTSNPSPAYIGRVSAVFADNGNGVRGDMKAVVRAVLLDTEARGAVRSGAADGKLKEPVLLMTSLARLIGFRTDGYAFVRRDTELGEPALESPTVFNFYSADYPLPGSTTLKSPVSNLHTTGASIRWHNLVNDWTLQASARPEFAVEDGVAPLGTSIDWSSWEALGDDSLSLINRLDLLMMSGTMSGTQRASLQAAAATVKDADPAARARRRAQLLIYIIGTSPLFLVDR